MFKHIVLLELVLLLQQLHLQQNLNVQVIILDAQSNQEEDVLQRVLVLLLLKVLVLLHPMEQFVLGIVQPMHAEIKLVKILVEHHIQLVGHKEQDVL